MVRIYLTGRPALEIGDSVFTGAALGGGQATALLAILAAERHRAVSRGELADHLWSRSPPPESAQALRSLVSKLRRHFGQVHHDPIPSCMGCYQLALRDAWVDLECARSAIHDAEAELAAGRLRAVCGPALVAASISRDPFLPGWSSEWSDARRRELADVRIRALECLAEVWLAHGAHHLAIRDAREVVRRAPFREPAYRQLIRAHAAAGSRAEAARAYEDLRTLLSDELGVAPSPETVATFRRALTG